nr:serine/threonine-protein kinase [uncultured Blautia sp.]
MDSSTNILIPWSNWKVVKKLGQGGFGSVYEIERNLAGMTEKAALKIISRPTEDELERDYNNGYTAQTVSRKYTDLLEKCVGEYKMLMAMKGQTNIVSCDDIAVERHKDGIGWDIYIRMELLTPLNKRIRNEMLPEKEVIKVGKDICKALMLCEERNIVHRDIKPDNIMISQFGDYELGDFGQAKIMDHTTMGTATGTPGFWAPEVMNFQKYGKEADIYSLGMVLYILLNNKKMPFIDADQVPLSDDVMNAISRRYHGAKIPEPKYGSTSLKKVVLKACEFKAENRYHSARMMYKALEIAERGGNPGTEGGSYGGSRTYGGSGTYSGSSWGASRDQTSFGTNGWQDTKGTIGNAGASKSAGSYSAGSYSAGSSKGKENQYNQKTVGADSASKQKMPKKEEKTTVEKTVAQAPKEEITKKEEELSIFGAIWIAVAVIAIGWCMYTFGRYRFETAGWYMAIAGIAGEIVFFSYSVFRSDKTAVVPMFIPIWKFAADVIADIMILCWAFEVWENIPDIGLVAGCIAVFIWPVYVMKKSFV